MTSFNDLTAYQKTVATIHRDVYNICNETCHQLGLTMTQSASEIIAEMLLKKLAIISTDLEAFAKHAKRQTINSEDVKLLVRRNPHLLERITRLAAETTPKEKRRKTLGAARPTAPAPALVAPVARRLSARPAVFEDEEMQEVTLAGETILKENTTLNVPKDKETNVSSWKSKQEVSSVTTRPSDEAVVLNNSAMEFNDTIDLTFD